MNLGELQVLGTDAWCTRHWNMVCHDPGCDAVKITTKLVSFFLDDTKRQFEGRILTAAAVQERLAQVKPVCCHFGDALVESLRTGAPARRDRQPTPYEIIGVRPS